MNRHDLAELDRLLSGFRAVVSMRQVFEGARSPDVVGLRHDVDDNHGSLNTALRIAAWEHSRGYRSTFLLLHTASYWRRPDFFQVVDMIAGFGHEIGIHADAIGWALAHGGNPASILRAAVERLRQHGHDVVGVAPHGNRNCYRPDGSLLYVNDEMFTECARPELGAPDRLLSLNGRKVKLEPMPLAAFGLDYECYRLPHGRYLSDSGGRWNVPPGSVIDCDGQLHVLMHPDWWREAFV